MRGNQKQQSPAAHLDCIIIMMLEEEKELLLKHSRHLLIDEINSSDGYTKFTFFDKDTMGKPSSPP